MQQVEYYNSKNIEQLDWPKTVDGEYAKNYLLPLILGGTVKYIKNVNSDISVIKINDKIIPIVHSDPKETNCYVSSAYDQYITYAKEELHTLDSKVLILLFNNLLSMLGLLFHVTGFNKVVYVNNWLLSTNLYPDLTQDEIQAMTLKVQSIFPKHIIIYRSLNEYTNPELMHYFENIGAQKILSRQVYITDPNHKSYKKKNDYQKDQKFLRKSNTSLEIINEESAKIIKVYYDLLYLDKYTNLNPQFTELYLQNAIKHKLFNFQLIKINDKHRASLGFFSRNNTMTTPIFGFDTKAHQKEGIYRILYAHLMNSSDDSNHILNHSSGAPIFKSNRGAQPYIEYNFYFTKGCSLPQRFSWKVLKLLLNSIGIYMLKKYKL